MVYIVASPEISKTVEEGNLSYSCFGKRYSDWPKDGSQEPHGSGNGSYVQDLSWLLVGWLYGTRPEDLPVWYNPSAKCICYQDRTTNEVFPWTHQPNYGTFYSACHKMTQDSVTGELGTKFTAVQEYFACKRQVTQADAEMSELPSQTRSELSPD